MSSSSPLLKCVIASTLAERWSACWPARCKYANAFVLLPLLGVVLQGTSSVLYATVGEFVEPDRLPRSFGLFYTIGSICGIAAPLGYGLLGDRFGVSTAIATMGVVVLLTIPLAVLLRPRFAAAPQA